MQCDENIGELGTRRRNVENLQAQVENIFKCTNTPVWYTSLDTYYTWGRFVLENILIRNYNVLRFLSEILDCRSSVF